ncbi:MAG: hypothetical protein RLZZ135_2117 [Cyanobacteriota bacterium]|jgi:hypothetical protein
MVVFHGGCHCGQLAVEFSTNQDPAAINPRTCDCSFCCKHGASYISDPAGRMVVSGNSARSLREYQQGTNMARFLLCNQCGVLVAVIYKHDSEIFGAVNLGCLDGQTGLGNSKLVSPRKLTQEEKVSRWLNLWVPGVTLTTGETQNC